MIDFGSILEAVIHATVVEGGYRPETDAQPVVIFHAKPDTDTHREKIWIRTIQTITREQGAAAWTPAGFRIVQTNTFPPHVAFRWKQRGSAWPGGREWTQRVIERVRFRSYLWNCLKNSQRKQLQIRLDADCTIDQYNQEYWSRR